VGMTLHPHTQHELARLHQGELLREAERQHLANLASRDRINVRRRLRQLLLRRRPVAEPTPSERAVSVPSGS
jgi:hypothetical protein